MEGSHDSFPIADRYGVLDMTTFGALHSASKRKREKERDIVNRMTDNGGHDPEADARG